MELKDYTTEELKAELKRRWEIKRQASKDVPRCRNCKHATIKGIGKWYNCYLCAARTFTRKGIIHNYIVYPSNKACDKYEKKFE